MTTPTTPTDRETAATQRLAEALMEFLIALDEGSAGRRAQRLDEAAATQGQRSHIAEWRSQPRTDEAPARHPLLLSARDAAKFLAIGGRLLWSQTAPRGPLPCVRIEGRVLYRVSDLEEAVEKMRVKPRKETGR